ncbi:MAG: hypothetical protein CFH06_00931 [Alphaproteobacteria bacterium MarineAlpha3_Bin5]|nr:hypothetical protein [Magnetovibrio sp.]PPR78162.1 MAG: hypothetical protein CFH06_00931 [Alphaproteobacteria bacterium MarineAlpha3_Bin5]
MPDYFNLFFNGYNQLLTLGGAVIVMLTLSSIGGVLVGRNRPVEADFVFGWGALTLIFTITTIFLASPLEAVTWGIVAMVPFAAWFLYNRDGQISAFHGFRILLLAAPLLLIASAMAPSQWDEFSHWLPAPRFLMLTDDIPSLDNPIIGTQMLPAYPYGWPYLTYFSSRITGVFLDGSGRVLNLLFLLSFGMLVMRIAAKNAGYKGKKSIGWKLAGFSVAFVTITNPTFIQKIIFTSYAETSTSVVLGFTTYLYWSLLNAQASGKDKEAWQISWQVTLASIALINIKQVNIVLLGSATLMYLLVAWQDKSIRSSQAVQLAVSTLVPVFIFYALWRYHVTINFGSIDGTEAQIMPFERWHVSKMHLIFLQMLIVAGKKIGFFGVMAVATYLGARAFLRITTPFNRLTILTGGIFLAYNGFLFFTYLASFSENQALTVVSFWRYNTHLGMLAVLFIAASCGLLWRQLDLEKKKLKLFAWLPAVLVFIAPFIFVKKLRFDLEPFKPHFTNVARELAEMVPKNDQLVYIDPKGSGESAVIARYITNRWTIPYLSAFHGQTYESIKQLTTSDGRPTWVLVHSVTPDVIEYFKTPLQDRVSYLIRKQEDSWKILQKWPYPEK